MNESFTLLPARYVVVEAQLARRDNFPPGPLVARSSIKYRTVRGEDSLLVWLRHEIDLVSSSPIGDNGDSADNDRAIKISTIHVIGFAIEDTAGISEKAIINSARQAAHGYLFTFVTQTASVMDENLLSFSKTPDWDISPREEKA